MPSNSDWDSDDLNGLKATLKTGNTDPSLTSSWCIYKVPPKLRKVNEEAYTPCVVSIGPYHHGNDRLKPMHELKVWYRNRLLQRTPDPEKSLEDYYKALKKKEDEIRRCYSETIHMKSHEFVSMVLTDACFIIEFFLAELGEGEHLVQKLWPTLYILYDLILLENQLPFFVLTDMFVLTFPTGFYNTSFDYLTFDMFVGFFLEQIYPLNKETYNMFMIKHGNNLEKVLHLCDVLRSCFLPRDPKPGQPHIEMNFPYNASELHETRMKLHQADKEIFLTKLRNFFLPRDPPPRQPDTPMNWSHSVSQLHEAGMKFQADKESFVTELKYPEGVFTIPAIVVNDFTETMLRNVIAFEQCHYYPSSCNVTEYVSLLDHLINNGKDVDILVGKKIIVNMLGDSNDVASMVNKLCNNVVVEGENKDYIYLCREMDKFCENRCHKYKAIFLREYWSTPWRIASVIAATLLLLLTFIQTISSVI